MYLISKFRRSRPTADWYHSAHNNRAAVGGCYGRGGGAVITDKRDIVCGVKAGERGVWRVGTLATVSYTMFGRGFVDTFTDTDRAR